jgi:hypothetical protein
MNDHTSTPQDFETSSNQSEGSMSSDYPVESNIGSGYPAENSDVSKTIPQMSSATVEEGGLPTNGDPETAVDRRTMILVALVGILLIAVTVAAVIFMLSNPATTETIRDIMIIFVAVEMSLIGVVLIILIIQIAQLSALLQNEIKPMLEATNETMNTLRGTSVFLSEHLTEPVIKVNSYASAVRRAVDLIRPKPRKK